MLDTLVVHPAYHRRGLGKALLDWGMQLAQLDLTEIGVIATSTGAQLYRAVGWTTLDTYFLENDEISPEGCEGEVMKYTPPDFIFLRGADNV